MHVGYVKWAVVVLVAATCVVVGALALVIAIQDPAAAGISPNCTASVTIDGVEYGPENDTRSNPIVIPDKEGLIAEWSGSTTSPITNYTGKVDVVIGPATVTVVPWEGRNPDMETSASDTYPIDNVRENARERAPTDLVGIHRVQVEHTGEGGSCSGTAMVKIEGNPLGSPVGAGAAAGTVVTAGGLAAAGIAKRPR